MSKKFFHYMIQETKYNVISMDMITKIFFAIGCILVGGIFVLNKGVLDVGTKPLFFGLMGFVAGFANNQYNFGEDAFRMLPLSRKEYQWMLIVERVAFQFIMSGIASLFTLPAVLVQGDFIITVKFFVCVLSMGLWLRHTGWINHFFQCFQIRKRSKMWIHIILEWIMSLFYMAVFVFMMGVETNVYLSAILLVLSVFVILVVTGIIRNYWMNKVLSTY